MTFLSLSTANAVSLRGIHTDVKDRDGYTRCIVELSGQAEFYERSFLERHKYFLVDIYDVSPRVAERFITPNTGPVVQIHALNRKGKQGDRNINILTLVFYLTDTRRYRVFKVDNPFRLVVDIIHSTDGIEPTKPTTRPTPTPPVPATSIGATAASARYRKDGKKIIIIDPGHGGSDSGAVSYITVNKRKVEEKDVNLAVAKQLKRLIDASPNMEAFLTRETDKHMSLADRRDFCKRFYGDLFISIHCNASDSYRSRGARGIEFYYLNPRAATRGATRYLEEIENRNGKTKSTTPAPNLSHPIFKKLAQETYSRMLQEGRVVCEYLKSACYQIDYYKRYGNRESVVQSANFYVLYQREMPAVLVELGFLTNSYDCKKLIDSSFQQQSATAVYNGVCAYFKKRDERFSPKYIALPAGP